VKGMSYISSIIINKHTNTMAHTLEQQKERIEKLMKTANNEDYLDLYQTLQGIKRDIVLQGLRELDKGSSDERLETIADEVVQIFS